MLQEMIERVELDGDGVISQEEFYASSPKRPIDPSISIPLFITIPSAYPNSIPIYPNSYIYHNFTLPSIFRLCSAIDKL